MTRRVVVTGLGVVAPNGMGKDAFAEAIFSGKSGIEMIQSINTEKVSVKIAGEVKNFNPVDHMPISTVRKTDRFVHLGVAAAKQAIEDAGIHENISGFTSASVIIGSGQGGMLFHESAIIKFMETASQRMAPSGVPRITPNAVSAYIAMLYKIRGPNQVISTACSSGAQAVGQAFRNIKYGISDVAITGGVEASISPVTINLYNALMVLGSSNGCEPDKVSKPFDLKRNGFVISEGAGMLVLESLDGARDRGAHIYAEISGFGSNCGAYHMVAPNPTGEDAAAVMREALEEAQIEPNDVGYINAHGTSTKWNDLAETKAVKLVFNSRAKKIPISSIKSMIGHSIGAAGGIEAVASCLCLERNSIPPTINLHTPDPECDLDYVPNEGRKAELRVVVSNSFGFGSNNAALVFNKLAN